MSTIKQQLRKFYADQGITGKALRSALRYDLRSIRKQRTEYHSGDSISGALDWGCSVEGTGYWVSRDMGRPCISWSPGPERTIR